MLAIHKTDWFLNEKSKLYQPTITNYASLTVRNSVLKVSATWCWVHSQYQTWRWRQTKQAPGTRTYTVFSVRISPILLLFWEKEYEQPVLMKQVSVWSHVSWISTVEWFSSGILDKLPCVCVQRMFLNQLIFDYHLMCGQFKQLCI